MPQTPLTAKGLILACLKEAYMLRLAQEMIKPSKRLTQELDLLELAIRDIKDHSHDTEQSESGA